MSNSTLNNLFSKKSKKLWQTRLLPKLLLMPNETKYHCYSNNLSNSSKQQRFQNLCWSGSQKILPQPCQISPKMHYFWRMPHAPIDIFEESRQHSPKLLSMLQMSLLPCNTPKVPSSDQIRRTSESFQSLQKFCVLGAPSTGFKRYYIPSMVVINQLQKQGKVV